MILIMEVDKDRGARTGQENEIYPIESRGSPRKETDM